jgi:3-isopropylmalate/(R)-2-methylmalate dehydratase small subunit
MSPTTRPLAYVRSRTAVLPNENIDTDRIIPARFLTTTERTGLGRHCFEDWRYQADGSDNPDFALNRADARGCHILVAGHNFGCGSSREHAPWALLDFGIRAVISSEIADIFRGNALKNGLLAIVVGAPEHRWLLEHPGVELRIDVASGTIGLPDGSQIAFALDEFSRHCLLHGVDQLGFLLQQDDAIVAYEQRMEVAA